MYYLYRQIYYDRVKSTYSTILIIKPQNNFTSPYPHALGSITKHIHIGPLSVHDDRNNYDRKYCQTCILNKHGIPMLEENICEFTTFLNNNSFQIDTASTNALKNTTMCSRNSLYNNLIFIFKKT